MTNMSKITLFCPHQTPDKRFSTKEYKSVRASIDTCSNYPMQNSYLSLSGKCPYTWQKSNQYPISDFLLHIFFWGSYTGCVDIFHETKKMWKPKEGWCVTLNYTGAHHPIKTVHSLLIKHSQHRLSFILLLRNVLSSYKIDYVVIQY